MKYLRPAIALTLFYIVVTGLLFPAAIYGIAQAGFKNQAEGSMIKDASGRIVGSVLIGQNFTKPEYFHPRPSAAGDGYDGANSGGTNLATTSAKLLEGEKGFDGVKQLAEAYRKENNLGPEVRIPADAVTRSASGLDPHISPKNAEIQAERVAKARKVSTAEVKRLIHENTDQPFAGIFGDPAVNVLKLNLALDQLKK